MIRLTWRIWGHYTGNMFAAVVCTNKGCINNKSPLSFNRWRVSFFRWASRSLLLRSSSFVLRFIIAVTRPTSWNCSLHTESHLKASFIKKKLKIFHYSLKKGDLGSKQLSQTISVWAAMVTLLIWLQLKHTKEQEQFIKLIFQPEKSKRPLNCDFHLIAFAVLKLRSSSLQQNKPFFFFPHQNSWSVIPFPCQRHAGLTGKEGTAFVGQLVFYSRWGEGVT